MGKALEISDEEWREHFDAKERQNVTIEEYCVGKGFSPVSFSRARKRIQGAGHKRTRSKKNAFRAVERKPEERQGGGGLTLKVPNGSLELPGDISREMLKMILSVVGEI